MTSKLCLMAHCAHRRTLFVILLNLFILFPYYIDLRRPGGPPLETFMAFREGEGGKVLNLTFSWTT